MRAPRSRGVVLRLCHFGDREDKIELCVFKKIADGLTETPELHL